ncbi:META domain-containing protein [Vibrio sp. SS-MA-C1-2]|uniref:META domain-containing protein n=1 Tax=Vibrio sp. SS-MA-C1-2 TaxID=2908646 RepID=UPI001F31A0F7|nr:META domain-containing protein [Vibrio sp. SS-MA-C1-2]UJF18116.1 META domain-containing protein [Vibrio sp. SS-MA-C1-2]
MKKLLAVLTLSLFVYGCSSTATSTKQENQQPSNSKLALTAENLQHHNWVLVKINDNKFKVPENFEVPNIEINEKLTTTGRAGCNNFFGQIEVKGDQLRIDGMGMTRMMCIGNIVDIENAVTATLSDWSDVTLTKEQLILKGDKYTLTYVLRDYMI